VDNLEARRPDFFIVGAAKCGTTSMYHYLSQHPDVFLPGLKEPHYFASDLNIGPGWRIVEELNYLRLFADAGGAKRVGEASPWYLFSRAAADSIFQFAPEARILILLRPPVDFINSIHLQLINTDDEDIIDLEDALSAEADRKIGRRLPPHANFPKALQYRRAACFSEQIQRYLDRFGRDRVRVFLLEDLRRDAKAVVQDTCRFLQVDPTFPIDTAPQNVSRAPTHLDLLIKRTAYRSPLMNRVAHGVPEVLRRAYRQVISAVSATARPRNLATTVRARLEAEFEPEVERLEALLDRDLSHWRRSHADHAS
jgi:hypothetical protein